MGYVLVPIIIIMVCRLIPYKMRLNNMKYLDKLF